MLATLKNWTLPIAMAVGIFAHRPIAELFFVVPYLIFIMLFLTFASVSVHDLKPRPQHLWLLLIQATGAVLMYTVIISLGFEKPVAEAGMILFITPTATAAAVVTLRLGGNAASVTAYTLMSNLLTAIAVPVFFPIIEPHEGLDFLGAFWHIMQRIFILLILPFICAQVLRIISPKLHVRITKYSFISFYLWACALTIVTAITYYAVILSEASVSTMCAIALIALIACFIQFFAGKTIGSRFNDRTACGQSLGQKNTTLAIWMANTYLNPVSSLGPGCYILWQNIVNSYQLWKKGRNTVGEA